MIEDILTGAKISYPSKIINEYEIHVGEMAVKIKIKQSVKDGHYSFNTSHYYHGPEQAGPYISSINTFNSETEALSAAVRQITSFYREEHGVSEDYWVKNKDY